jgi:deoxyxylulose-5-phosphate synthase
MRFVKPIDEDLIRSLASSHNLLVTLEENTISGGAGSAVTEFLSNEALLCLSCSWVFQIGMWTMAPMQNNLQILDWIQTPSMTRSLKDLSYLKYRPKPLNKS